MRLPMRKHSIVAGSIGAMAMATVIGCEDPVSRVPSRPSPLAFAGLEISGPDRVAPGQSAQFTAIIRLADGTRKAASADTNVQWTTSDGQLLRVNGSGLATAQQQFGDVTVRASVSGAGTPGVLQSAREVTVLPDGTFRVVGTVRDATVTTLPIYGARLEVTPGQLATTSNFEGRYALFGVPAEAEVRISRDGYHSSVQTLRVTANATRDFELEASGPRSPVPGPHTLTVDVTGTCSGLPTDLQHRRYEAMLTQQGTSFVSLTVTLTEPRFKITFGTGNSFWGRPDATGAVFTLWDFSYYYYPDVVEQLPDGSVLEISGTVTMRGTAAGMSGKLTSYGGLSRYSSGFPTGPFPYTRLGGCSTSSDIVLTLTPR